MLIRTISDWSTRSSAEASADSGATFVGVAIGPNSDDGRVSVNGYTLQAGRALALRESRYQFQQLRGLGTGSGHNVPGIGALQVVLFETVAELALATIERPDANYSAVVPVVPTGGNEPTFGDPLSEQLFVPFSARRACRFQISGTSGQIWSFRVTGWLWSSLAGLFIPSLLTRQTLITPDESNTLAFYEENETWDYLSLTAWIAGNSAVALLEATATGEKR